MSKIIKLRNEVFYKEDSEINAFGATILTLGSEIEIDGITHWFEFTIYYRGNNDSVDGNLVSNTIYHHMLQYNINNPGSFKNNFTGSMEAIYNNIVEVLSYDNKYELAAIKVDKDNGGRVVDESR